MADERRIDDPQLLRLLWRGEEVPSPRSGLTVSRTVSAGIEVADEVGLDGLSMRRVAERLGVGAMSLYTYVPGRQELILLMVDQAMGELGSDVAGEGWRERLTQMAEDHRRLYDRHPWLLDVPLTRSAVGPNVLDRYELELSIVDGLGLDELEMNAAIELVQSLVAAAADRSRAIRRDADASGLTDDDWWYQVLPTLSQVLVGRDYPLSNRVGEAIGAPHLDTSYLASFGLERVLDGLETMITDRAATS